MWFHKIFTKNAQPDAVISVTYFTVGLPIIWRGGVSVSNPNTVTTRDFRAGVKKVLAENYPDICMMWRSSGQSYVWLRDPKGILQDDQTRFNLRKAIADKTGVSVLTINARPPSP